MPDDAVRELDQLAGHDLFQAMDAGDAVADRNHRADLGDVNGALVVLDLLAENAGDFVRSNLSHSSSLLLAFRAQAVFQGFQLAAHRAVVNCRTDARHHAADQRTHPPHTAARMRFPVSFSSRAFRRASAARSVSSRADDDLRAREAQTARRSPLQRIG